MLQWLSHIPSPVYWSIFGVAVAAWAAGVVWLAVEIRAAIVAPFFDVADVDEPLFVPMEWAWPTNAPEASR